jgi:Flp pilus assembly protein TadG
MKKRLFLKCQQGAAAVEFGLVLFPLMLIVFGIINFGIYLYDKAVITNASREGARTAILYGAKADGTPEEVPIGDVETVVKNYCTRNFLINFSGSTIPSVNTTGMVKGADGRYYRTVTVQMNYNWIVFPNLLGGSFTGPAVIKAETRMRTEWQDPI